MKQCTFQTLIGHLLVHNGETNKHWITHWFNFVKSQRIVSYFEDLNKTYIQVTVLKTISHAKKAKKQTKEDIVQVMSYISRWTHFCDLVEWCDNIAVFAEFRLSIVITYKQFNLSFSILVLSKWSSTKQTKYLHQLVVKKYQSQHFNMTIQKLICT